jgi:fumarate reductase flavoprotein subunit
MGVGLGTFYEANDMLRAQVEEMTVKAGTIDELARKMEVPAATFKATIDRYNEMARKERDLDFGKRADRLTTVESPPFYAGIIEQHILVVLGGLNTNTRLQPLDADRKVIPGLYLAGNTVGNRFAVDYPTMCAGLSHGFAWTTGRLAGLYAASEKG